MLIVIKISGEALKNDSNDMYDNTVLKIIATQIKQLQKKHRIMIVIGGGNIFRGRNIDTLKGIERSTGDYMGMLATLMNALLLRDICTAYGIDSRVVSAIQANQIVEPMITGRVKKHLEKKRVVIFGGGLGTPYFTTDTTTVQRALELKADLIIMTKNGVQGVYDSDPRTNKNAIMYKELTATESLKKNLTFADNTAIALAREHKIKIKVVSLEDLTSFEDKKVGTMVIPE
ncbi:MAG: UMP kinase [Alphaproteobacteria bacterium]|nr:UMP kinase [Alphaproteobacteria bacterium]